MKTHFVTLFSNRSIKGTLTRRGLQIFMSLVIFGTSIVWGQSDVLQQLNQAEQLEQQGEFAKVVDQLPRLIKSNRLSQAELGPALLVLGFSYQELGNFTQARKAYERALSIESEYQAPPEAYATALSRLAELYLDMGDVKISIKVDRRVLALYERSQLQGSVARSLVNLAGLELTDGHRKEGGKYLSRAIEVSKSTKDLDEDFFAAVSSTQAWLAGLAGDTVAEMTGYQHALEIWKGKHGEDHVLTGWGYLLLGQAQSRAGKESAALKNMQEGLGILGRTVGSASPKYISGEYAYSQALDRAGSHEEASRLKHAALEARADLNRNHCIHCSISVAALQ